jgi:hypothetical protein
VSLSIISALGVGQTAERELIKGDTLKYQGSSTAAYRMYARSFTITIVDVASSPVKGNITFGSGESAVTGENLDIQPYVLNRGWNATPEVFPIMNSSFSYMGLCWQNSTELKSTLEINIIGGIFADQERSVVRLNYTYQYEIPNRLDGTKNDTVVTEQTYMWDFAYGILLYQYVDITNLNDTSLTGHYALEMVETSLWALSTEGIPGYPLLAFMIATISTIGYLSHKNKGRNKHE